MTINTRRAHRVRRLGDITVVFTWVNDERAMILLPTYRKGAPWFIVMDSAAWQYTNPAYLAAKAAKAAEVLQMDGQEFRLATIMHDGLEDLVLMPSSPPPEKQAASVGQMVAKADGRVIGGDDVRPDVVDGPTYG